MSSSAVQAPRRKPVLLAASRPIARVHRWLGLGVGFMFALWFATGTVISFVPFPALGVGERISGSEWIDFARVRVPPAAALTAAEPSRVDRLRLINVAGHPRYVLSLPGRPMMSVSAETGAILGPVSRADAMTVAERFNPAMILTTDGPFEYDQWTVHDRYDAYRPFYRVSLGDASGTDVYVSTTSGEVVQQTRRVERAWNCVGAVVHWLNAVSLRKHKNTWWWVIWSVALSCGVLALAGAWLGAIRYVNLKRAQRPGLSPYRGLLRWHHSIGLFAAVLLLSWITSGWLSLDRGALFSSGEPTEQQIERFRGLTLAQSADPFPLPLLRQLGPAREVELAAVGGHAFLILREGETQGSRLITSREAGAVSTANALPDTLLLSAVRRAWPSAPVLGISGIARTDAYNIRSDPLPETARRVRLDDSAHTWVQIDAASGQILSVLDTSRRVHRWLVDGLHTFDFPVFQASQPLRHAVLVAATTTGFLFSCTGLMLALKRLRRRPSV